MAEKKEKTLLAKQRQWIFVLILICAILFPSLFFLNMLFADPESDNTKPTVGRWGEKLSNDGHPFIFDPVEKEDIAEIILENKHGTTRIYRAADKELYVEGAEDLFYNPDKMAKLYVNCRYMLSFGEAENANTDDFALYGLAEDNYTAKVKLTTLEGKEYVVYIGDFLDIFHAYYARLEGRPAIYLLDNTIQKDLLADIKEMFVPTLTLGTNSTYYYMVDNFNIKRYGKDYITIKCYTEDKDLENKDALAEYRILYPTQYVTSNRYDTVLQALCTVQGEKVLEYNLHQWNEPDLKALLKEYKIYDEETDSYPLHLSYDYLGKTTTLYFSEPFEEESGDWYYHVYSPAFNMIANMKTETFPFLQWGMLNFVESNFMSGVITKYETISFSSHAVSASFKIHTEKDDDGKLLVEHVEVLSSSVPISKGSSETRYGHFDESNTKNFQRLYTGMLYASIYDYGTMPENTQPMLTITFVDSQGGEKVFKFYRVSSLYCFFTLNDVGEFTVSYDYVQKIISNTRKVMYSELVDYGNLD
ncbi:MAG TPA: hypothetical protein DCY74_09400 [Clostridiales bacterium]|jgi:hypothetical protein|nr:hypothetical protein [Clostridiales bacterium]HBE14373.1 hypothetical protein [Clostridiales bacterium]HCG36484.1 hypothetical protein [Clostridiales bacterium]